MRKIYLILAMMLVCVLTASATVVWPETEGTTTTYGTDWSLKDGTNPTITAAQLSDVAVGDELVVTFSVGDNSQWAELAIYNQDVTESETSSGGLAGKTSWTYAIDDKVLTAINAGGITITGCNVTISKIEYNKVGSTTTEAKYGKVWPSTDGQTTTFTGWSKGENDPDVLITKDKVPAEIKVGDKLVVKYTALTGGTYINLWPVAGGTALYDFGKDMAGFTEAEITINDAILAAINADGVKFTGNNITYTEVDIEKAPEEGDQYGTAWEQGTGTACIFDNGWNQKGTAISIDKSAFSNVKAGDKIVFTFTVNADNADNACLELWRADFGGNIGTLTANVTSTTQTTATFTITEAALTLLQAGGLMPTGRNLSITKVEIVKGSTEPTYGKVWPDTEGQTTTYTGNWQPQTGDTTVKIAKDKLTGAVAGDKLVVHLTCTEGSSWNTIVLYNYDVTSSLTTGDAVTGLTEFTYTIDDKILEAIDAGGLAITGAYVTISQVDFVKHDDTPTPSLPANAIWPETVGAQTTFANWAITTGDKIEIPASKFTGIAAGDKVIVKVADVAAAGGHLEMWKSDYSSLVDAAYNVDFTSDKTEYEFVVTADAATALAANGCVITGNNVTVTEVDRDPMPTTGINGVKAQGSKPDAWYNLQGQRVNAPVHGVYIHNGRKVIKK